jgi:hypothetical protein
MSSKSFHRCPFITNVLYLLNYLLFYILILLAEYVLIKLIEEYLEEKEIHKFAIKIESQ